MKVMFMGSPDIAVPCLDALHKAHQVVCVATQTDKPKGRGQKMTPPPVKVRSLELGIPCVQPQTLKGDSFAQVLDQYAPEVIVVVAYGKILPKTVLEYPKYGCINVHASLLPKYRGAAPIQWVIVNGEKVTGITTMQMAEGLDTGDMLLRTEIPISPTMTAGELHDLMCQQCPPLLLETLSKIEELQPIPQDDSQSCYAPLLNKETCRVDWSKPAQQVVDLIRGMNPFPTAHTTWNGKGVKLYRAVLCDGDGTPGMVLSTDKKIVVACGQGAVSIEQLQPEGKRPMSAIDFLNGSDIREGRCFV